MRSTPSAIHEDPAPWLGEQSARGTLLRDLLGGAADLPAITDVLPAVIASVDANLPGADSSFMGEWGLEQASQQLVILVDGLGLNLLESRMGHAPTLRAHRQQMWMARTILPSTTAAAITSFGTGALPGQTRMVGYSVAHNDTTMNLLAFAEGINVHAWQPVPTLFERLSHAGVEAVVISPPTFASSGLTQAALRGSRHRGAVSLTDRINAALNELRKGTQLVYLYWSEIDHVGHKYGAHCPEWTAALEEFDAGLKTLLRHLPTGVQTVLTADHGMIDIAQHNIVDLADTPQLAEGVRIIAGETRALHVHAHPGCGDAVRERWADVLGARARVFAPDEAAHILGEGPGVEVVGDAFVLMSDHYGVVDSRIQSPGAISLVGVHGSYTDDEILIPIIRLS